MECLIRRLENSLPVDDGLVALVHGDYRLDNLMFAAESPKAIALLDWELSTLPPPYADLGYLCLQMRMPRGVGNISGLQGKNLEALGIPTEQSRAMQLAVMQALWASMFQPWLRWDWRRWKVLKPSITTLASNYSIYP